MQLAIGECKTRKEITEQDVTNLTAVADLLESKGIEPFVVFSKLSDFSDFEPLRIKRLNLRRRQRAIVLTEKELQHWFPYQWVEDKQRRHFGGSLSDFAAATAELYLQPAAAHATLWPSVCKRLARRF